MGVTLDHTIVWCRDQHVSAHFLEIITRRYGSGGD
jgi:hypothetical protein